MDLKTTIELETLKDMTYTEINEILNAFSAKIDSLEVELKRAYLAGADKSTWTKVPLTGVVSGRDYELEPIFEEWQKVKDNAEKEVCTACSGSGRYCDKSCGACGGSGYAD